MAKYTPSKSSRSQYDKWSTGYYGKAKGTKYEQSSFWMDDSYMSDLLKADTGHDVIRLASYQKSIANFVKILTNRDDINVRFHRKQDSWTDNKTVTISSKLDSKNFDATVGLALHEGSHCALTTFDARIKYAAQHSNMAYPEAFSSLVNMIEDRRIDYYVMRNAPGYQGYYKAFYEEYFNSKEIDRALIGGVMNQETVDHYLFHICNFINPNRNLNTLKRLKQIWKVYDLANIARLKNTMEVCELAHKIHDIIAEAVAQFGKKGGGQDKKKDEPKQYEPGEGDMQMGGAGNGNDEDEEDMQRGQDGAGAGEGGDDEDDQDMDDNGESGSDEDGDAELGDQAPEIPMTPKLKKAIQQQLDFLNGKPVNKKTMTDKIAEQIEAIKDADIDIATIDTGDHTKVEVVVLKGTSASVLQSDILAQHYINPNSWNKAGLKDAVEAGWVLGTLLGKKLKTRDENRTLKSTRLKSGKIDGRLMAELGFGNTQVFSQVLHYTVKPCTLHISLDASGSMGGEKWKAALKTSVAIAKACSMISNIRVVIDIRGGASGNAAQATKGAAGQRALVWVVYDSKKDSTNVLREVFPRLYAGSSTPEGLCFDAIMKYIVGNSKGTDSYFINVSDGEPAFNGYHGRSAETHTQAQVNKMRTNNINVLSYFVHSNSNKESAMKSNAWQAFTRMYGKDATLIDLNDFNALSKTLNSLFERGVDA